MPVRVRNKSRTKIQGMSEHGAPVMLIRIRGTDRGELHGDIIQYYLQEPVPFQNIRELIFRIDGVSRLLRPAPEEEFHSLKRRGNQDKRQVLQMPESCGRLATLDSLRGEEFFHRFPAVGVQEMICLELIGRQHMSLQGRIRGGLTGGKDIYFRSALELMILLSELAGSLPLHERANR